MFELFENERTKTIHSSIVHSSEIRDLCLLIGHIFGNQNLLSYYSMKDQGVLIIEKNSTKWEKDLCGFSQNTLVFNYFEDMAN